MGKNSNVCRVKTIHAIDYPVSSYLIWQTEFFCFQGIGPIQGEKRKDTNLSNLLQLIPTTRNPGGVILFISTRLLRTVKKTHPSIFRVRMAGSVTRHLSGSTAVTCCVAVGDTCPNPTWCASAVAAYFAGVVTSSVKFVLGQKYSTRVNRLAPSNPGSVLSRD